jgi:hypothetical protein
MSRKMESMESMESMEKLVRVRESIGFGAGQRGIEYVQQQQTDCRVTQVSK